jgi:hypothetical protein
MSELEAATPENGVSEESRIHAALAALEGQPEAVQESEQAPPEPEVSATEDPGVPEQESEDPRAPAQEDDQPLTPGEDNIEADSSRLATIARRERRSREQAREREDKIVAREQELEERLKKAESLEKRLGSLKNGMRDDPVGTLKDLGIDDGYADVAGALYDEELGDESTDEWKAHRETRELQARIRKLEREQTEATSRAEEEKRQVEVGNFQRQYVADMNEFLKSGPEDLKYANAFYASRPEDAIEAMYGIAVRNAEEDPSSPITSPRSLAEDLNKNLTELLSPVIDRILEMRGAATEDEPLVEEDERPPKTLRNAQSTRTTKRTPAQNDDERLKRALAALER